MKLVNDTTTQPQASEIGTNDIKGPPPGIIDVPTKAGPHYVNAGKVVCVVPSTLVGSCGVIVDNFPGILDALCTPATMIGKLHEAQRRLIELDAQTRAKINKATQIETLNHVAEQLPQLIGKVTGAVGGPVAVPFNDPETEPADAVLDVMEREQKLWLNIAARMKERATETDTEEARRTAQYAEEMATIWTEAIDVFGSGCDAAELAADEAARKAEGTEPVPAPAAAKTPEPAGPANSPEVRIYMPPSTRRGEDPFA